MNFHRFAQTCAILVAAVTSAVAANTGATDFQDGANARIRTTAYTATEPNGGGFKSAVGTPLSHSGPVYSAAADWSWMPLGTVFRMKDSGRTYKVEDYGSALVGRKTVDIYMPNDAKMNAWGVRQVDIEIVEMGSFQKSLSVLEPRKKSPHVRKMIASLRQRALDGALVADASVARSIATAQQ
jgi:3D (Asp-Asp-Asp) domain-containing protein